MWKKVLVVSIVVTVFILGLSVLNNKKKNKIQSGEDQSFVQNESNELSKYVTDDCIEEWEDYANFIQDELKETGSNVTDENRIYIIKAKNDIIEVYYLGDNNEEILYKTTEISTKYLPKEDVDTLKNGIKVQGIQKLNQKIEDFE